MPADPQASASAFQYIGPFLGWAGGFATALLAEPIRQRLYRPTLRLDFGQTEDYLTLTPEQTSVGGEHKARYIRVRVINSSARMAKACRAYLTRVERQVGHQFNRTSYGDSLQLGWSALGDRAFGSLDLPPGVPQFIDVISTREIGHGINIHVASLPFRYKDLLAETTTYRLTVHVGGDWVTPSSIRLLVQWTGQWKSFPVTAERRNVPRLPAS